MMSVKRSSSLSKAKLKNDPKNRSENLMIVDLLRNDMSKIIKVGSLRIKKPMKIIKLKTLFQAISPLKAKLKNRNLSKIFNAVFPCGSITGAPKLATMRIIKRLEPLKRDLIKIFTDMALVVVWFGIQNAMMSLSN